MPHPRLRPSFHKLPLFMVMALLTLLLPACAQNAKSQTDAKQTTQAVAAKQTDPQQSLQVKHVIQISVDAMGALYLQQFLADAPNEFDAFAKIVREGATTFNARTDYAFTNTLPNHTSMITGRPVTTPGRWNEAQGHYWKWNGGSNEPESIHATNPQKQYTASTFDVVHDHGLSTALYSGKDKFSIYTNAYGEKFGSENEHGKNKIDFSAIIKIEIQPLAMAGLKANKPAYTFLHYADPDYAGHAHGYLGDEYRNSLIRVNGYLKELLAFVESDPEWKGKTVIIISADHGGAPGTKGHGASSVPHNYTLPFLVWGAGIAKGADLYQLNADTRKDPGTERPDYARTGQPIRNGDGGNLALKLLGLPPIPGSHINDLQDLKVSK